MKKNISKNEISTHEKRIRRFGRWFVTPLFAVGSAMITTVAVSSLSFIAALAFPWLLPLLAAIFIAETAISVYLFKDSVPDTLTEIFIHNIFKNLSPIKKVLLGLGLFCAVGAGLCIASITYTSGITAVAATLGIFSLAFPPLGIAIAGLLAVVGFISISGLFIRWISNAIKKDIHLQIANYFKRMFTRDPRKLLAQQVLEVGFKLLFTTAIIALTAVGTIATLGTMRGALMKFLSLIPQANLFAIKISSAIISYGLMGIARLPWALQSVCSVASTIGEFVGKKIFQLGSKIATAFGKNQPSPCAVKQEEEHTIEPKQVVSTIAKISAVIIHGFSFGALARMGGGQELSHLISDLNLPISPADIDQTGQLASMVTGGAMAGGVGAFALFFKPKPIPKEDENDAEISLKEVRAMKQRRATI